MFPFVPSKDQPYKERLKERKWQQRITVKTGIPEYSPLKDKHTGSYRKLLTNIIPIQRVQSSPKKQTQSKTYFEKKVQLFEKLKSTHPVYLSHLEEFEDFVTSSKIPNFYAYYSLLPLVNEIDVNGFIMRTKKAIKDQTSSFHRISAAIKAREECLVALKKSTSSLQKDFLKNQEQIKTLKEVITHYRSLTTNAIDQIKRWRDSLNLKEQRAVYYFDNNQNYLIKMLNDNQFLFSSILADVINFGEKNDPFIIVPLKKAEGKESSEFLDVLETEKNLAYYQKYMEYLASQKAYVMSLVPVQPVKRQPKYPEIQKIYKSKSTSKFDSSKKQGDFQQAEHQARERQRQRQQRLKKNQQRLNAIKSVYQSYSSRTKLKETRKQINKAQTDVEDKTRRQKYHSLPKSKNLLAEDEDFQKMVRAKIEKQKSKRLLFEQKSPHSIKSLTKLPKTEDKMIQNLKEIQQTLKSKLSYMHEQTKIDQSPIKRQLVSTERYQKKNNESLISELKSEIIRNLEIESQDREAQRMRRRQEEEKAIEEIKVKMKRQMEEKMQVKKREKLIEREQLEKKLKEEEQRLNKQRQLELQLQLKLAREKELRQLEKVKRESLQKEMKFRQELQKEQRLRKQKQEVIQRERREMDRILEQLKKKELKQQLEKEIKEQMKSRYGQNQKIHDNQELSLLRVQQHQQFTKEIQVMKLKQNQEIEQIRKQNHLRQRMLKLKKEEQQLKRKEIQHLMKSVIQQQKEELHRDSTRKRMELQEDIRNNAKEKLLEEYRAQREAAMDKSRMEKERQMEEQVYREKIREKIEKDLRMEAIQKTRKEMEEREDKRYQTNMKLQNSKIKFKETIHIQQDIDRSKIQQEVKKELIQKVIFDKQAEREAAKNDLRSQFQRQLMASALPQIYESNEADPIMRKNIQKFKDDDFLRNRLNELQSVKPTNQKAAQISREDMFKSVLGQSPKKKNQSLMNSITNEERQMYSRKKARVDEMRSQPSYKLPKKLESQQEGFELLPVESGYKESEVQVKMIRMSSTKKSPPQLQYSKKKVNKIQEQRDSQDQPRVSKRSNKVSRSSKKKKIYQSQQQDSQDQLRFSLNKKNLLSSRKHKQSDEAQSSDSPAPIGKMKKVESMREQELRRSQTMVRQNIKRNQTAPRNQLIRRQESPTKLVRKNTIASYQSLSPTKIYYDAQSPSKIAQMIPQQQKIQLRQVKHSAQSKFEIKLQAIPQGDLDQYLAQHFAQLPEIQHQIQLYAREQLYRKLINQLTFCMLLGYSKNVIVGMALAFHDRTKIDVRKFTIVHFSTYHNEDLKDFLLSCVNYIFKKDPTDQIQFHYKFDQAQQHLATFSTDFNKWFDKFGNVYQKKISDSIYQRKYAFKRQFNQKCQVVLGGVNKNTFRNLFTVYCGVVMSDADMIQFKTELRDVVTTENQISYSIAMAELFRTYLTPDEAEILKGKVKEFAKLKELLILVVMLQKKKVKLEELKLSQFKSLVQLNMKLMSQGKDVIRYCKDSGMNMHRIFYAELSQAFNLPFNFQTTSLPIQSQESGKVHHVSYFRLSPLPPNKLHIIKSSLYNSELHILPTQSTKYKLFVINAQQYNEIKESNHLDIFMYVRLFLKNVKSHNTASWKYVWLPEMSDKANFSIRQFKSFLNKDIYCHDSINISYRQFLPNALIIEPQHRDLVITPPFIVGVMSMALEQVTEGSPLYARMIDVPALRTIEIQE